MEEACWGPFILKLQPAIASKRLLGQIFEKNYRHDH